MPGSFTKNKYVVISQLRNVPPLPVPVAGNGSGVVLRLLFAVREDAGLDPNRMWTDCGISTVDKTAPYYRTDGYWNGAVWMPHQWFVFLGMLAIGRCDDAAQIARTALDTWKRETDATYNSYEHFVLESGRGSGWHHFSGLSTPP